MKKTSPISITLPITYKESILILLTKGAMTLIRPNISYFIVRAIEHFVEHNYGKEIYSKFIDGTLTVKDVQETKE